VGENKQKDEWELALDKKIIELQECQKQNGVTSCLKCDKTIGCELRKSYVKAVYESMNKGSGGGFEF